MTHRQARLPASPPLPGCETNVDSPTFAVSAEQRRLYEVLRRLGAGPEHAARKALAGNYNPYTENAPVVEDEAVAGFIHVMEGVHR